MRHPILPLLGFCTLLCTTPRANALTEDSLLRRQIGQMIVAGFRGFDATGEVADAVQRLGIGGVIYFDRDVPAARNRRNVRSPQQLQKLSAELQRLAQAGGHPKLFITIDQEGGRVNRLKPAYGFPASVSAEHQGRLNDPDTTRKWASLTAMTCSQAGINVDFAPCVDVNIDPQCPVIGALGRSFSGDPAVVAEQARIWTDALHERGVLASLKHFPGHGSSRADSHLGLTDITQTWQEDKELAPYRTLIDEGYADFVMVGHLMHRDIDAEYPASLSQRWIAEILRGGLGYRGVVITDDLNMRAIVDHYSLERALELAINAGADMVIIGNNGKSYEPDLTQRTFDILCRLVEQGRISRERIAQANDRIRTLKARLR
ncbi:glycoside hydrolase family 3 N-terminal domain-containing protein [uncultured Rikenella sp.]|uniref:glycoside hydrolase family 3 protein n=1 Tax=uncultured Rikenella sp. TaxID=368003 RepID=UPI002614DEC0|nr:glycoside hydrolase family 3 N-terminal domain-containing protein [uncultured Rikenella sp.]